MNALVAEEFPVSVLLISLLQDEQELLFIYLFFHSFKKKKEAMQVISSCFFTLFQQAFGVIGSLAMNLFPAASCHCSQIPLWCFTVALNFQSLGLPMDLNDGRFQDNGGCGYILKPAVLTFSQKNFDPSCSQHSVKPTHLLLKVHLLSPESSSQHVCVD